jgi:chemotaxis protein methyltransferase CheR
MRDAECVAFLQWAAPRLGLRWPGFRRVRGQVCRRIDRRRAALGLMDLTTYRDYLVSHVDEWRVLDELCRVTISRFARDREVWARLIDDVLPRLAHETPTVRAWSAGCGAGEEPYTLVIAWQLAVASRSPAARLDVLATDTHAHQLARAAAAVYPVGTLRELPEAWRVAAFEPEPEHDGMLRLRERFRTVRFAHHDLRTTPPAGPFDLVLCRNVAFTYFAEPVQRQVASALRGVMRPGGVLVVGMHEQLPDATPGFAPYARCCYLAR